MAKLSFLGAVDLAYSRPRGPSPLASLVNLAVRRQRRQAMLASPGHFSDKLGQVKIGAGFRPC